MIGLSTVSEFIGDFYAVICNNASLIIEFSRNGRETGIEIEKFKEFIRTKISQVDGAIDGTHIEIMCNV